MKRQSFSTPYGKTKIYSAKSQSTKAGRVLVVPGFSETTTHSKKLVDALANQGFDASTFSQPRGKEKNASKESDPIQRQGKIILALLESNTLQGEKVHAVAHSLGSAAVLKAAQADPGLFASITLMQPVGLVGEQSLPELSGRVSKKIFQNQKGALRSQKINGHPIQGSYAANVDEEAAPRFSGRVTKAQVAGLGVLARQPILAFKEALAVGNYNIADNIAKVTELGIPVHIVTANNDEMFDQNKVNEVYEADIHSASSYSNVADHDARHDTFWMQPERTARIIGQLINKI